MGFKIVIASVAVAMSALAAHAQDASVMVGTWYGSDTVQKPGMMTQWVSEIRADGRYSISFRSFQDCKLMTRSEEEGRWSLDGKTQVFAQEIRNGSPSDYVQKYDVIELTPAIQRYRSIRTGNEYTSSRVAEGFQLPDCK